LPTIAEALQQAVQFHQAGQLQKAEQIYRQILRYQPQHADAMHLLGLIAHQVGQHDSALRYIADAIALDKTNAVYHNNLGEVYRALGRTAEAQACYREALRINPRYPEPHNNLGILLKNQGKLEEAQVCYRQALQIKPDYAEAHNNLGLLFKDQAKWEEARDCFQKAVGFKPNNPRFHNNFGVASKELGRLEEAKSCYQQALRLKPDSAEVHNNLGLVYSAQNKWEEATASFYRALQINPKDPEAHNYLGIVCQEKGSLNEAENYYRKAIELNPAYAAAQNNLGLVYKDLGRLDEAEVRFREALRLKPDFAEVRNNLAQIKTFHADDPDLAALKDLEASGDTIPSHQRVHIYFALGKASEDLGEYDQAFQYWNQGNRLKRQSITYQIRTTEQLFERVVAVLDEAMFQRWAGSGCPSELPVFIVGMPRSGTTLIEQILASHPQVHGAGELKDLPRLVGVGRRDNRQVPFPEYMEELRSEDLTRLGEMYVSRLRPHAPHARRIVDKMPSNFCYAGLIHLILPDARIIHCLRDPIATCLSCYGLLFKEGIEFSYDLEELGRFYRLYEGLMAHWRKVLPEGRILEVRYEDVVADLETQAHRIVQHCGLEWDEACLAFHATNRPVKTASATQVRQPIYKSSLERWRRYEKHLGPLLASLKEI
jgi:Flp pilus assembly protein TadD